ncbi:MAG: tRNA (guanosine(46)-N7)-methyltransferase TrmB [Alphaproteobacteria bacterium]|nr:tRNA (guanosine(46)-N7)-methyltransferase TrmB [Alphaproteobacteria bacterium]
MSHPPLRTYGRIKARALKPRQEQLVETLLPTLAVDLSTPLDPRALFPTARAFVLEIGFGGGEHLAAQAAAHPDHGFIGVEPFLNGVGSCLRHIDEAGLSNVRLHMGDARDVLAALPDAALDRVDILFPDPWPKARHHKRRLVRPDFVAALARVVKPGGEVRFATDWANYAATALEHFVRDPHFQWTAECAADWRSAWPGHVATRYEEKKLGDCAPVWLRFLRASPDDKP